MQRIVQWLNWHSHGVQGAKMREIALNIKMSLQKQDHPRHQQLTHMYSNLYFDSYLKKIVDDTWETWTKTLPAPGEFREKTCFALLNHITHEKWDSTAENIKAKVRATQETEYKEKLACWAALKQKKGHEDCRGLSLVGGGRFFLEA